MKPNVDKLLQKQMDRKDFLKHLGIGFAVITGAATVVKTLAAMTNSGKSTQGYGANAYGGRVVQSSNRKTS